MKPLAACLAAALLALLVVPSFGIAAQVKKSGGSACEALPRGSPEYRQCEQARRSEAKQARQACAQYPKGSPDQRACRARQQAAAKPG